MLKGLLFILLSLTFSTASGQIFISGENILTVQGSAQIYTDTIVHTEARREPVTTSGNSGKIYVYNGTVVTNLANSTRVELIYVGKVQKSIADIELSTKAQEKTMGSEPKVKPRIYPNKKITEVINVPLSDSDFHQKSRSKVVALTGRTTSSTVKSNGAAVIYDSKTLIIKASRENALGFYLDHNSISRALPSLFTRPPPFLAFI